MELEFRALLPFLLLDELRLLPVDADFTSLFGRSLEVGYARGGMGFVKLYDWRIVRSPLFRLSGRLLFPQVALSVRVLDVRGPVCGLLVRVRSGLDDRGSFLARRLYGTDIGLGQYDNDRRDALPAIRWKVFLSQSLFWCAPMCLRT
mgnify:CR=1 FL=1